MIFTCCKCLVVQNIRKLVAPLDATALFYLVSGWYLCDAKSASNCSRSGSCS